MVAARDLQDGGRGMTDAEISDTILTVFPAGTETTACTLAWALGLLARRPEVEQRLHDEVDTVLRGNPATHADSECRQHLGSGFGARFGAKKASTGCGHRASRRLQLIPGVPRWPPATPKGSSVAVRSVRTRPGSGRWPGGWRRPA
ncbi:cytochrome P450 [Streptomyces pulveraceus]|uniref:cytochrome P450 n=1 Tax=Streptomyces pulveraceus TaxID=68258 RepID=UPI0031D58A68